MWANSGGGSPVTITQSDQNIDLQLSFFSATLGAGKCYGKGMIRGRMLGYSYGCDNNADAASCSATLSADNDTLQGTCQRPSGQVFGFTLTR